MRANQTTASVNQTSNRNDRHDRESNPDVFTHETPP
jgi:hypothetical protein